jgi:hypothetical protein
MSETEKEAVIRLRYTQAKAIATAAKDMVDELAAGAVNPVIADEEIQESLGRIAAIYAEIGAIKSGKTVKFPSPTIVNTLIHEIHKLDIEVKRSGNIVALAKALDAVFNAWKPA